MNSGYVYLNYIPTGEMAIMDSAQVVAEQFKFSGKLTEPTKAWFSTFGFGRVYDEGNVTRFYIEPGDLKLYATKDHFKALQFIGSALTMIE